MTDTRHDANVRYLDACNFAIKTIGDAVTEDHFTRLLKLSRTNSTEELKSIIKGWAPSVEAEPVDPPSSEELTTPHPWRPCQHFGGDKSCPRCREGNVTLLYEGVMAIADEMFQSKKPDYRAFVRSRIHAESSKYMNGESSFDDLEQLCWQAVALSISRYEDRSQPLAWLRTIVFGVVTKHFRDVMAGRRDVRKTVAFAQTHEAHAATPDIPCPAKPTAVPVAPENDRRKTFFNSAGIPFTK